MGKSTSKVGDADRVWAGRDGGAAHLKLKTALSRSVRKFMDNEIAVDHKLTIDGDKLKGKGASEFGGKKQEFDIEA